MVIADEGMHRRFSYIEGYVPGFPPKSTTMTNRTYCLIRSAILTHLSSYYGNISRNNVSDKSAVSETFLRI